MAGDGMMRASDADRDAVVDVLRDAYTAGRLTLEEFGERTSAAYAGKTWSDLRELTADLPERPALGADVPESADLFRPADPVGRAGPRDPAELRPGVPRHHPRPAGTLMPFVMVWFLIVIATRSTAAVAAPVVVLALLMLFTAMSRRK